MVLRIALLCSIVGLATPLAYAQESPPPPASQPAAAQPTRMDPDEAVARARQLKNANQFAAALDLLKRTLVDAPGHIEGNLLAAEILMESNDYDLARTYFKNVLDREPSNYRANLGTGKIWVANRTPRQATIFLERAESVAPPEGRAEVKRLLATAYTQMGQTQQGINKALEAVQADTADLDAQLTLVQIRQMALQRDPQQMEAALADAEKYVQMSAAALARSPFDRKVLQRLAGSYQILLSTPPNVGVLQALHNSFYGRNLRGEPTGELLPGKGPDAAAVLMRIADVYRQQALVNLIGSELDAILMTETAVSDKYDARNVKYLEQLAASYAQLQDLLIRLVGPAVTADPTLSQETISVYQKILQLDPNNERARQYLQSVGAPLTTQPAGDLTEQP